jgi:hypothetical protein
MYTSRRERSSEDYFLASRGLTWLLMGLSSSYRKWRFLPANPSRCRSSLETVRRETLGRWLSLLPPPRWERALRRSPARRATFT